jgi:hypothetical protein
VLSNANHFANESGRDRVSGVLLRSPIRLLTWDDAVLADASGGLTMLAHLQNVVSPRPDCLDGARGQSAAVVDAEDPR